MSKYNRVSLEVNEERMIIIYPDLYCAGTIGMKGILRKLAKLIWGTPAEMSAPLFSPGRLDRNGRNT